MNARGQVFTLDLIVGLVLIILAVGILLQVAERTFAQQSVQMEQDHVYQIASTASQLLVSSPEFTCNLVSGSTLLSEIPNCLPNHFNSTGLPVSELREKLGIPITYDFCLSIGVNPCTDSRPPTSATNVASIDRYVVLLSGNELTKERYYYCLNSTPSCSEWTQSKVTIQVWQKVTS